MLIPPPLTDTQLRQRIWVELQRATQDRHHAWRTPVLATLGADGWPQARTVVLRHANAQSASLAFYTDARSHKVAQMAAHPCVSLVFWSTRLRWQLRVQARMSVLTSGSEVQGAWARVSQTAAAGDYLSACAPGAALPATLAPAGAVSAQAATHHLAVLIAQVQQLDWLELGRAGHLRAVFDADTWAWQVP